MASFLINLTIPPLGLPLARETLPKTLVLAPLSVTIRVKWLLSHRETAGLWCRIHGRIAVAVFPIVQLVSVSPSAVRPSHVLMAASVPDL